MNNEKCPSCGFTAHFVSSDGKIATYVCDRCKTVFKLTVKK